MVAAIILAGLAGFGLAMLAMGAIAAWTAVRIAREALR